MRLRFDDLTFDAEARQLWVADREVPLSPKAFDLLAFLIARRPEAVSKADIRDRLWPATFVSESSLPSLVSEIRDAIEDHRRQAALIRTVHGFGYAFRAEPPAVQAPAATGSCSARLVGTDFDVALAPGENVVGREGEGIVVVRSSTVSRRHARIVVDAEGSLIQDLGSKNGTYVNDRRVGEPTPIVTGDQVRFGSLLFTFRLSRGDDSTETVSTRNGTRSGT
jgi:DNA-binding winged helix-turn-helix (wHTH) protein